MLTGDGINRKGLTRAVRYFNEAVDPKYHIEEIEMVTNEDVEKLRDDFVAAVDKADEERAAFRYQGTNRREKSGHVVSMYVKITGKPFPLG